MIPDGAQRLSQRGRIPSGQQWGAALAGLALGLVGGPGQARDVWDWQLTEPYDLSVDVQILVVEPDDLNAADIAGLKDRGVYPICYVSVGTWEDLREDAARFPNLVLGNRLDDWPGERHIDVRQLQIVVPLMAERFRKCAEMGFNAIEPDNMDGFENDTGFDITIADSLNYMLTLEQVARDLGLWMVQKNTPGLVGDLKDRFAMAIVEECFLYDFCEKFEPYIAAGKPVLVAEYAEEDLNWEAVCARAADLGFHLLIKQREVVAGGQRCN